MEGILHYLRGGNVYLCHELYGLLRGIQYVAFKTIENFQTVVNPALTGNLSNGTNVLYASCPIAGLVDCLGVIHRPIGIDAAPYGVNVQIFQFLENIRIKFDGVSGNCFVGGCKIFSGRRPVASDFRSSISAVEIFFNAAQEISSTSKPRFRTFSMYFL